MQPNYCIYPQLISSNSQNNNHVELEIPVGVTTANFGAFIAAAGVFQPRAEAAFRFSQYTSQFSLQQFEKSFGLCHFRFTSEPVNIAN